MGNTTEAETHKRYVSDRTGTVTVLAGAPVTPRGTAQGCLKDGERSQSAEAGEKPVLADLVPACHSASSPKPGQPRLIAPPHVDGATAFRLEGWDGTLVDRHLRQLAEVAAEGGSRTATLFGNPSRRAILNYRGSRLHLNFPDGAHVVIQRRGRPYVEIQSGARAMVEHRLRAWMDTWLPWLLTLVSGSAVAEAWSLVSNTRGMLRWKTTRFDIAADFQGLDFSWEDIPRFVARASTRGFSKVPGEDGFDAALDKLFKKHDRDYLLDVRGRGVELQTIQIGANGSRTAASLHRKDRVIRAKYGCAAADSFYAHLLWQQSGAFDPTEPVWRAEFRFFGDGLNLVERSVGSLDAHTRADAMRAISPYDLAYLASDEAVKVLWGFATNRIKLRKQTSKRARDGLDERWLVIQAAAGTPPYRVEQSRSRRARELAMHDELRRYVTVEARQVERAAALVDRPDLLADPDRGFQARDRLTAFCRRKGLGPEPCQDRAERAAVRMGHLGDARDVLRLAVDPQAHLDFCEAVALMLERDYDPRLLPGTDCVALMLEEDES